MDIHYKSLIYFQYLQCNSNYLQYKSNYTTRHECGKYYTPVSSTSSSATRPTHLERGQLIWKIQKDILTINIVGWHFSQLVWNRPSSSTRLKAPAHLEESKGEDWLNSREHINFIITSLLLESIAGQPLNHGSSSTTTNSSGEGPIHLKKKD